MKICPKCNKEHKLAGKFCSRTCANSRVWTRSHKAKLSEIAKQKYNSLSDEHKSKISETLKGKNFSGRRYLFLMENDFEELSRDSKRIRVLLEQDNKCNRCNISEWQHETITLELEHKDGNKENNSRENLEGLCPNCHSLTKTWRGRKNGSRKKRLQNMLSVHIK